MTNLEKAIHKQQWQDLSLRRQEDEIAEKIFQAQRNSLISFYCLAMRTEFSIDSVRRQVIELNGVVPSKYSRPVPEAMESTREWFSAAVLLLTHTDEETQKQFLTLSDDRRTKLIQAVIDDGGIWHDGNHWQEIPA